MAIKERMSGNEAVSYAIRQVNPDVMPAFPITPSTEIPQMVSTYIANGEMDTEFIPVESEHSSMSAAIGAEAAGARSLTATSSAGLALMWEELLLAASNRLPLALTLVNRTLSGPININCDHSDGMGARDTGWIQIYAENNQEAYDNFIQAYPIAEDKRVHLPIMICQDGFITSHAVENIELMEDKLVKEFVLCDESRNMVCFVRDNMLHLWRHVKPKYLYTDITFGFDNPELTGKVLGAAAAFCAMAGFKPGLTPDFEQSILEGKIEVKGRITFVVLLKIAIRVWLSEEVKSFRKEYNNIREVL